MDVGAATSDSQRQEVLLTVMLPRVPGRTTMLPRADVDATTERCKDQGDDDDAPMGGRKGSHRPLVLLQAPTMSVFFSDDHG